MNVILILGCKLNKINDEYLPGELLLERLEEAVKIYHQLFRQNTFFLVSGGFGKKSISESQIMKNWLIEQGKVDPSMIIEENKSVSTIENFIFSKLLLDQIILTYNIRIDNIYIVSSDFHIPRMEKINQKYGNFNSYTNTLLIYIGSITKDKIELERRLKNEKIILNKIQ